MKNRTRVSIFTFAALLLLIAAFPPDVSNGWQFLASEHLHKIKWSVFAMEYCCACAVGLMIFAVFAEEGEK